MKQHENSVKLKLSLLFYNIVATFQQIRLPKQDSEMNMSFHPSSSLPVDSKLVYINPTFLAQSSPWLAVKSSFQVTTSLIYLRRLGGTEFSTWTGSGDIDYIFSAGRISYLYLQELGEAVIISIKLRNFGQAFTQKEFRHELWLWVHALYFIDYDKCIILTHFYA